MNKYKKLARNSLIFSVGMFASRIVQFLLIPIYTSLLSVDEFGMVDLVSTTLTVLLAAASLNIYQAVLRFCMEPDTDSWTVLRKGNSITFYSSILIVALALVAEFFSVLEYVSIIATILIAQLFDINLLFFARGTGRVKLFALSGIIKSLGFAAGIVIFMVGFKMGILGYYISLLFSELFSLTFLTITTGAGKRLFLKTGPKPRLYEMLKYAIPLIPNSILWWAIMASNRYYLAVYHGLFVSGIFAIANKIPALLTMFTNIFNQAWQLSAVEEFKSDQSQKFFSNVFNLYISLLVVVSSGITMILPEFFRLAFKSEYYIAWRFVPLLLLSILFSSISSFLGNSYIASKETGGIMKTSLVGGLLSVVLNLLLVPKYGGMGSSIALVLSFFSMTLYRYYDTGKYVKVQLDRNSLIGLVLLIMQSVTAVFLTWSRPGYLLFNLVAFLCSFLLNIKPLKRFLSSAFLRKKRV